MAAARKAKSQAHIERLTAPGHKFRNLNPFWVLDMSHEADENEVRRQYRRVSLMVHPDRNQDNEDAQTAFEYVNKAYETLSGEDGAFRRIARICYEVDSEFKRRERKRERKARRERRALSPFDVEGAIQVEICNRLTDIHAERVVKDKIREAEERSLVEEAERIKRKRKAEKAFEEEWERDRADRIQNWRKFHKKRKKLKGKKATPKLATHARFQGGKHVQKHLDRVAKGLPTDTKQSGF